MVAAVLQSSFAPVLCPEKGGRYCGLGLKAGLGNLVEAFPARGCESGGEVGDAECLCLKGCRCEAYTETLLATGTSFWLLLKSADGLQPCFMVVVAVYPRDSETFGMTLALVLSDFVLFVWKDVGIEVEYGGTDVVLKHPFDNG